MIRWLLVLGLAASACHGTKNDGGELDASASPDAGVTVDDLATTDAALDLAPDLSPDAAVACPGITALRLVGEETCVIRTDHTMWCWGKNPYDQTGATGVQLTPTQVTSLGSNVFDAAVSQSHICAVLLDHTMSCGGLNSIGQLGRGTASGSEPFGPVPSFNDAVEVCEANVSTCARKSDGTVWCWGDNSHGELGDGKISISYSPKQTTSIGTSAVELGMGSTHGCARENDGSVWCWGADDKGQLGDGAFSNRSTPMKVGSLGTVTQLRSGAVDTCVVESTGDAVCWGDNSSGQMNDGTTTTSGLPVKITALGNDVFAVAPGYATMWALKNDHTIWSWGGGQTGVTQVQGHHADLIAAGNQHVCIVEDGAVYCWGANGSGQLGTGDKVPQATPHRVDLPCP